MHQFIYASMHLASISVCIYASMHLCIYTSIHLCIYASTYLRSESRVREARAKILSVSRSLSLYTKVYIHIPGYMSRSQIVYSLPLMACANAMGRTWSHEPPHVWWPQYRIVGRYVRILTNIDQIFTFF